MSRPAQACTTVATTKMAGISQSIVSRCSGTYMRTIRPSPVARATCHLRRSAASPSSGSSGRSSAGDGSAVVAGPAADASARTSAVYPACATASTIDPGSTAARS
jgi:hypothetical protein